ncbi:MAG: carbon starvation CstA family protein, partial [Pirellulaceae bacterium]
MYDRAPRTPDFVRQFLVPSFQVPGSAELPEEIGYFMNAMPLMLGVLAILAVAYRYYSAFLAAKVAAFDDRRTTPAHLHNDGQNDDPTNRWVLFGHHFAAISGAGPLIGPVLAIQFGYMPGLIWLVIGVCLAGAVQDMLVLWASVRTGGKSLAEIARSSLGPVAGT